MRSHFITAAVAIAAFAPWGCPDKREPVPAPQSTPAPTAAPAAPAPGSAPADGTHDHDRQPAPGARGSSEISWFQGTLDEAFARTHRRGKCPTLRY